jgi:hypothetical protein
MECQLRIQVSGATLGKTTKEKIGQTLKVAAFNPTWVFVGFQKLTGMR